jgi:CelD/BcsL family acetyltransferase involved in cellulose biosynthesis
VPDRFRAPRNVALLERIQATRTEAFAGILSALYAGPDLVAVHMGMRSREVWHWWFPAYEPRFARYSPGTILLLRMAAEAGRLGIRAIDLGRHDELYKERLKSGSVEIAEGTVSVPSLTAARLVAGRSLKAALARTPLGEPARALGRAARSRRGDVSR